MSSINNIGKLGEKQAKEFLIKEGYTILEENFTSDVKLDDIEERLYEVRKLTRKHKENTKVIFFI